MDYIIKYRGRTDSAERERGKERGKERGTARVRGRRRGREGKGEGEEGRQRVNLHKLDKLWLYTSKFLHGLHWFDLAKQLASTALFFQCFGWFLSNLNKNNEVKESVIFPPLVILQTTMNIDYSVVPVVRCWRLIPFIPCTNPYLIRPIEVIH